MSAIFPVLLGAEGDARHAVVLAESFSMTIRRSPRRAPAIFSTATEMDEMLALRVMTLTDGEKNEMRLAGGHGRDLLQRTEETAREQLTRTHGTIRSLRPVSKNL